MFFTISTSTNTQYGPTDSNKTLAIVPTIYHTSPYLNIYYINNIHTDIKASTEKHRSDMKCTNNHISDMKYHITVMLSKVTDTGSKTDKQEEKITGLSYKISTYEYHMD